MTHGLYAKAFVKGADKALFNRAVRGQIPEEELLKHVLAALYVRTRRAVEWEGEARQLSAAATGAFAEFREALAASKVQAPPPPAEGPLDLLRSVEDLLRADRDLLLRQLPEPVRKAAEAAWAEVDAAQGPGPSHVTTSVLAGATTAAPTGAEVEE